MEVDNQRLANKRFGEILSDGLSLFGRNYVKIIIPFAFFMIISKLLLALLLTDLNWNLFQLDISLEDISDILLDPSSITDAEYSKIMQYNSLSLFISFLHTFISTLFTALALCSVSIYLYKSYIQEKSNFANELKYAFNTKLILIIFLIGLGISIGNLLLFIPSIIILGFFIFIVFTYNIIEIKRPALEARRIAKGSFFKIIAIFLICSIIEFIIVDLIYQTFLDFAWYLDYDTYISWYHPDTRNYAMIFIRVLVYDILSIILAPLFICFLTPLFASAKAKNELGYQHQRGYRYRRESYPERERYYESAPERERYYESSPPQTQSPYAVRETAPKPEQDGGMFCPYCGHNITSPKKFCPSCGESLDF